MLLLGQRLPREVDVGHDVDDDGAKREQKQSDEVDQVRLSHESVVLFAAKYNRVSENPRCFPSFRKSNSGENVWVLNGHCTKRQRQLKHSCVLCKEFAIPKEQGEGRLGTVPAVPQKCPADMSHPESVE